MIFAQTGGNDPSFNLRRQDCLLLRQRGKDRLFASVFETHGLFDEAAERCEGAKGVIENIEIIGHTDEASVIAITGEVQGGPLAITIMVSNRTDVTETTAHSVTFNNKHYHWQGYFAVATNQEY